MDTSNEVVMFVPPKKLSKWFVSNENSKLEDMNVWCFDFETAHDIVVSAQLNEENLEILPVKL